MLNSNKFKSKAIIYTEKEFDFILSRISMCHYLMLKKYDSLENNENLIRNRLYKDFLNNNEIREKLGLTPYIFHPEIPEINDNYFEEGRTDLKVYNATVYTKDTNSYYVLECKRLDGTNNLNKKYIYNGILRFVQEKYPTNLSVNCMIGFIVKKINISDNLKEIKNLTKSEPTTKTVSFDNDISVHHSNSSKVLNLKHLMLDFSSLIELPRVKE